MPCIIKNPSNAPATMPYPFRGVLGQGQAVVLRLTAAQALLAAPGIGLVLQVQDLPATYPGPYDDSYQDGRVKAVGSATYTPTFGDQELSLDVQCTVTLDSRLPEGTTFVFWDGSNNAGAAPHTIQTDGTGSIRAGAGSVSSWSFNRTNGAQVVKKMASNVWMVGQ